MVCFFDAMFYGLCVNTQSDSDDIMDDSYDEYLAIRSKYRLTKDPKTLHRLKAMVFPHKYKTDEP